MQARFMEFPSFVAENECVYFKAENLVLMVRSESVGFAEIVNKNRMVGTKAQSKNQKTILHNKLK